MFAIIRKISFCLIVQLLSVGLLPAQQAVKLEELGATLQLVLCCAIFKIRLSNNQWQRNYNKYCTMKGAGALPTQYPYR